MQPAYDGVQPAYDGMQAAHDRNASCMHAACSMHTTVCRMLQAAAGCVQVPATCTQPACGLHAGCMQPALRPSVAPALDDARYSCANDVTESAVEILRTFRRLNIGFR